MNVKTNKSFTKRLRITRRGKILARQPGKNHFNAKESRANQLAGKRPALIVMSKKTLTRFVPGALK